MKTAVRRVLLMSALMSPGALYALGLGEIHLNSALNQPFDAEIELVSATQEDLGALRAALASSDTFVRYGLDRPAYLSDFNFRVSKGAGGRDVLRVTSPRPVTEPFVTLLVEANWPRGRLLREYTVLLDPPVFAPGPAASETVATPRVASGGATSSRAVAPVAEAATAPAPAPRAEPASAPAAAPTIEPGGSYRVRPNDTLWQIASKVNPGTRSDVNRAMVSIFQQNPQAFDGNINVLRSGSTLRIPDANQIQGISASAASAEVARQYESWRSGAASGATEAGRLRLVTPDQGTAAPSTTVASQAAPTTGKPGGAAAGVATPSGDIEARVKQLESELAEARRLLEVRNAELATLQGGAAAPAAEGAPAAPAEGAAAPAPTATEGTPPPAEAAAAPAKKPVKKPAEPVKKAPAEAEGPSLVERLADYWWVLAGLLAAGLGFLLFQRMRRTGAAEDDLEVALGTQDLRATPKYTPRSRENDILVEEKRASEPVRPAVAAARDDEPTRKMATVVDTLSGEAPGSTESGDPLAEADFHMAYGLYDQAADLVQLAIKREPQRRDLKLKLLETYFVWGNKDKFVDLARELNATRAAAPAGEWDKVLIMGKQIAPGEAMFAAAPTTSADSLDMELHGTVSALDLDISGGSDTATDMDVGERDTAATDATGLDFMLDDGVAAASPGDSQVAPTIETPRVRGDNTSAGDTEELTVDNLGLDVDALRDLEALSSDDTLATPGAGPVEDTVETPAAKRGGPGLLDDDGEEDLLSSTSMLDATALMESEGVVDLSEVTGEMPVLESDLSATGLNKRVDFDLGGEPPTMSEVGTKLDLARAYMDMGDPEGARSILDEVLQEGNSGQRQEAERLIASLP